MKAKIPENENEFDFQTLYLALNLFANSDLSALGGEEDAKAATAVANKLIGLMIKKMETKENNEIFFTQEQMVIITFALYHFNNMAQESGFAHGGLTLAEAEAGVAHNRRIIRSAWAQNNTPLGQLEAFL